MSLPTHPPHQALTRDPNGLWRAMTAPIKRDPTPGPSWRTFAVQCAVGVTRDGLFGSGTERAVKVFQAERGLTADGVVGPRTQRSMLSAAANRVQPRFDLPHGLLEGLIDTEGAGLLAAVNWYTPPGGRAGCDCGPSQRRIYGPPFDPALMMQAFDAAAAFDHTLRDLQDRVTEFQRRRPSLGARGALEAAVLAHNWPAGADQIVRTGRLASPNAPAEWTSKPGGGRYTRGEWVAVYVGRVLRHVG